MGSLCAARRMASFASSSVSQRGLRPAVFEHVGVVFGGQERVDGDRHDTGVQAAEKTDRPVGAVEHQKQHALFTPDAGRKEGGGELT